MGSGGVILGGCLGGSGGQNFAHTKFIWHFFGPIEKSPNFRRLGRFHTIGGCSVNPGAPEDPGMEKRSLSANVVLL